MSASVAELNAALAVARKEVDATGYGHWVSNDLLIKVVRASLAAADAERAKAAK